MLNSVLSTPIERASAGVALASLVAAGASVRASGCTATENGRSWFWITGVVSRNSGRDARSAGPRLRANGSSSCRVVALAPANARTLPSVSVVCCSVAGNSDSVDSSAVSLAAMAEKLVSDALISDASWPSTPPSELATRFRLWIARRMLLLAGRQQAGERPRVAVQRRRTA